jgi:uracil-DNA glycosylase family 4
MATAELIRAYLDWQSEMGADEVILPHPLVKKNAVTPPNAATSPTAPVPAATASKGPMGQAPAGPSAAVPPPSLPTLPSLPTYSTGSGVPGSTAPADLFQSLVQSLESAGDARRESMPLPGASKGNPLRPAEALNLPAFPDLEAFWTHLEKHPGLLRGEAPSPAGSGLPGSGAEGAAARLIRGCGPANALALVGYEPSEADAAEGLPFRGEAGALLEKMMRAIRLETRELYLTHLIKFPVPGKAWSRRELTRILPLLHAELALVQAPMVLILGQECAQTVLKTGKTLEELRQETHFMEGRPFFVTYHPHDLLRNEALKRKAWEDLQWLQRRMAEARAHS